MCLSEAERFVDSVVTGEAEPVWAEVLQDVRAKQLKNRYEGGRAAMDQIVPARHDLLPDGYGFGSIQTTRGCSLNCPFCSVTKFNGSTYRQRPIADVVEEFKSIPENRILIVDDNLIGRKPEHIERASLPSSRHTRRPASPGSVRPLSTSPTTRNFSNWQLLPGASACLSGLRR